MSESDEIWAILRENSLQLQRIQQTVNLTIQGLEGIRQGLEETRQTVNLASQTWDETRQIVNSNARAIQANSEAIATLTVEGERDRAEFRASVADLVAMITAMMEQSERDRTEFRDTVRQILDALTERFKSNGHSEGDRND